jgi:hypothetical protein
MDCHLSLTITTSAFTKPGTIPMIN